MEKILYPSPYMRITQGFKEGTHAGCYALDDAGSDGGIDFLIAPFTGTIKKIYTADANEVWLESNEKVLFADGTVDYATIMLCHDNDVSNLFVGKIIKQGERFYEEGTKGYATGNHVHFEIAKGKFTGTGWHKDEAGYWSLNNGTNPVDCFMIDDSYTIINNYGYNFKHINDVQEPSTGAKYLNLNANVDTWRVYAMDVAPVKGNQCSLLKPSKFGGLSYTIHGYAQPTVAIIETRDFGKVQIYFGPDKTTEGKYSITDAPVYGLVK